MLNDSEAIQAAIRAVAEAYMTGDGESLQVHLHEERLGVHGSDQGDHWRGRGEVREGLRSELRRHREALDGSEGNVRGSLVDFDGRPTRVNVSGDGDMAWSFRTGDLTIDNEYYGDTSWTTILERDEGDWKIVHSHFSIHR